MRRTMRPFAVVLLGAALAASTLRAEDDAWRLLSEGNGRFTADRAESRRYAERRTELAKGQHPRVVVLGCADSRVPPEIIFDQGLGDLFVVRSAGNVASAIELGSIEYGLEHLHAPMLVVLGHQRCGAVKATIEAVKANAGPAEGNIGAIVEEVAPAVRAVPQGEMSDAEHVEACVRSNVKQVIRNLLNRSSVVRGLLAEGKIQVVGAKYSLESGQVEIVLDAEATRGLL